MAVAAPEWNTYPCLDSCRTQQTQHVAAENQSLFFPRQAEQSNFLNFNSGMKPWSIGAEQKLSRSRAFYGLNNVVVLPHSGSIRKNIGIPGQLVHHLLVCSEIIGIAAKMSDDENYVRILRGKHVHDFGAAGYINQKRQVQSLCRFADLTSGHAFMPVNLDTAEGPFSDGVFHHLKYSPRVADSVNKSESNQPARIAGDDARDLGIGDGVIAVERRHDNGFVNSSSAGAAKIGLHPRLGVPWRSHFVAEARVTVAVDDHPNRNHTNRPLR